MKAVYVGKVAKQTEAQRKLGIPTAVDRVIQQAIAQVLTPIYEPKFADFNKWFKTIDTEEKQTKAREIFNFFEDNWEAIVRREKATSAEAARNRWSVMCCRNG